MSEHLKRAEELRAITERHYNCAQSVFVPFAKECGLDEEQAYKVAANFGAGMKVAGTCGAITGGLMVLGMLGVEDPAVIRNYFQAFKDNHEGCTDCVDLLRINAQAGKEKKPHCDAMVYEAVKVVEKILAEQK
ncbi:MAG: C-GCAxxG-C-C family protein [Phascolarctobacterium sp.]|nr:C-GCAxxG-C-C family protein [Phascolarctobacterium sp.]